MDLLTLLFRKKEGFVPLQKKGDLDYEIKFQIRKIEKEDKIIRIVNLKDKKVILYRSLYDLPEEESSILLRLRVISKKGLCFPEPKLDAFFSVEDTNRVIDLAEINIIEEMSSEGYGSILVEELLNIAKQNGVQEGQGMDI
jgi:N-acetylglutamate synthase-like GNAT family acetyltransferase